MDPARKLADARVQKGMADGLSDVTHHVGLRDRAVDVEYHHRRGRAPQVQKGQHAAAAGRKVVRQLVPAGAQQARCQKLLERGVGRQPA
eukprot:scaffold12231_cov103-Isochrysis_galbana.AAC.4